MYKKKYPVSHDEQYLSVNDTYHILNGIKKYRKSEFEKKLIYSGIGIILIILYVIVR